MDRDWVALVRLYFDLRWDQFIKDSPSGSLNCPTNAHLGTGVSKYLVESVVYDNLYRELAVRGFVSIAQLGFWSLQGRFHKEEIRGHNVCCRC